MYLADNIDDCMRDSIKYFCMLNFFKRQIQKKDQGFSRKIVRVIESE